MVQMINALLECLVTGLFCALFLTLFVRLGWVPMVGIMTIDPTKLMEEEEDPFE